MSDGEAEALVVGDGSPEEGHGTGLALALHDPAEGHARGVVDADMEELPSDAAAVALALAVAGDAMADLVEFAELFDVDVDHLAGPLALVAAGRFGRLQGAQLVEAQALEGAADRGGRDADRGGDLLAGHALAAQAFNTIDHRLGRRLAQPMGPRAAVLQAGQAFLFKALDPFTSRARANACGFTGGLRRLPTENHFGQVLSTVRRKAGILVHVHSALPRNVDVSTTSASSA